MDLSVFKKLLFLFLFFPSFVQAKEVDQFTDRLFQIKRLTSGLDKIDQRINVVLKGMEIKLNRLPKVRERDLQKLIYYTFQSWFMTEFRTPLEYWVQDHSGAPLYYAAHRGIYGSDIDYDDMGLAWYIDIAPIIRMDEYLIGVDKIGHFFGQGWFYYKRHQMLHQKTTLKESQILENIRRYGHDLEMRHLGAIGSGVYSVGDLAANWQGFQFYQNLFSGSNPYFEQLPNGKYKLTRLFHFLDYISDDWDEVQNSSYVHSKIFYNKLARNIQKVACTDFLRSPKKFFNVTGKHLQAKEYRWKNSSKVLKSQLFKVDIRTICNTLK